MEKSKMSLQVIPQIQENDNMLRAGTKDYRGNSSAVQL
jgi:hypothetical protein